MKFMLHSPDLGPVLAMQETILQALIGVLRRKGTEVEVRFCAVPRTIRGTAHEF